jgi:hypothetical protein
MTEKIKNVPWNNPSLMPMGNYDIDIINGLEITIPNKGTYGSKNKGNWSIVHTMKLDSGKEITMIDLVTLKKILDKYKKYPELKKGEVASLCQLILSDGEIEIRGDIVKVKKAKK